MYRFARVCLSGILVVLLGGCAVSPKDNPAIPESLRIRKDVLLDKIKGGWAGQTIGCSYGGPTEFRFKGTMVQDYVPIEWNDHYIKSWFDNFPGLFDDVYMDLTFVSVFNRLGLDAPADSFAVAFANAEYVLWAANQMARYNVLHGIMPPASGHWLNNPHADDIDYQIEADYSGLMSPGMPNAASEISDKIGHIMSYGNGWYGGVFVGAMYSLAFVLDNPMDIVTEAIKVIPLESRFRQCIDDVVDWYRQYPEDWKQTWFECQKKWSEDIGNPNGVFEPYNIDAMLNSAYVVIGLLYGEGDFFKTMDISTRCGQDSDCNPATAAGILGTMLGYSNIPAYWMSSLREVEDIDFAYMDISLNETYKMSYEQALQMIVRNGGNVEGDEITIVCQQPATVPFEEAFTNQYPKRFIPINKTIDAVGPFTFEGTSIVFRGGVSSEDKLYVAEVEMYIDGKKEETVFLPADYRFRRDEPFWKYQLPKGTHTVEFKWLNPKAGITVHLADALVYSDTPNRIAY